MFVCFDLFFLVDECVWLGVVLVRLGLSIVVLVNRLFDIIEELNCFMFIVDCFDIEYYLCYWIFDGICNNFDNFFWGVVIILYIWMLDLIYYDVNGLLDFVGFLD